MIYFISRILFKILLKTVFRFEINGSGNIPKKGPFIMVSNHVSYADPVVMGVACNTVPINFMAKRELFDIPIFNLWFKAVGCIPIERNSASSAALKKAVQKLKQGMALGIFPEGRRSPDGKLRKAEPGVGLIVAKTGVPIIPLYISGTEKALPIGKKTLMPCKITAKIGKTVDISQSMKLLEKRKIYESIGEKIIGAISRLKDA